MKKRCMFFTDAFRYQEGIYFHLDSNQLGFTELRSQLLITIEILFQ